MNYNITINKKHILIGIALLALLSIVFFGGMRISDAAGQDIKLLGDKNFKFHIFNTPGLPEGQGEVFDLPTPQERHGDIHIFKAVSVGIIRPEPGVSINTNNSGVDYNLHPPTSIMMVADALNDTWWIVNDERTSNYP